MSKDRKPNLARDVRDNRAERDSEQSQRLRDVAKKVVREADKPKGDKK